MCYGAAGPASRTVESRFLLHLSCTTLWLRMQQAHDLWHAERDLVREVSRIHAHKRAACECALHQGTTTSNSGAAWAK